MLSLLLRFTDSDYSFGIFKLFLLGMDVMNRKSVNVVTRSQFLKEKLQEQDSKNLMENCGVIPQDCFNENKQPEDNTIENNESVNENQNTPAARGNADMLAELQRNDPTVELFSKAFYWKRIFYAGSGPQQTGKCFTPSSCTWILT